MQALLVAPEHLSIKLQVLKLRTLNQPVEPNVLELKAQLPTLSQTVELNVQDQ